MKPGDLGLQNLEDRRKSLILSFAKRSLADGHFSDLINKRNPNHIMKTRKRNFYEVTHANTERFKNSPCKDYSMKTENIQEHE